MQYSTNRLLRGTLAVLVVCAIGGAIYLSINPLGTPEPNTEFYVLNEDGQAADYPGNLSVSEEGTVQVGIQNNEGTQMAYRIVVQSESREFLSRDVTVAAGESWQSPVTFAFDSTGQKRVELLLFREGSESPYRELRLVISVEGSQ